MARGYRLLSCLIAVGSLAAYPVAASETCLKDSEKIAFDVRAAQTEMMIAALQCGDREPYNVFMRLHATELYAAHARLADYFRRSSGGNGEEALDAFITELANSQSIAGAQEGERFCPHLHVFVQRMINLRDMREVSKLNTEMQVVNPYTPMTCGTRRDMGEQLR